MNRGKGKGKGAYKGGGKGQIRELTEWGPTGGLDPWATAFQGQATAFQGTAPLQTQANKSLFAFNDFGALKYRRLAFPR